MKRKLMLPVIALLMLGFAVYHVVRAQQEPPKSPPPVEPSRSPFRGTIAGSGVVEARTENISIGSHPPGVVAEVFVNVDDSVSGPNGTFPGSPLFRLDDRQLRAELAVRRANLKSAQASLLKLEKMPRPEEVPPAEAKVREARASLDDAKDQFQRAQQLLKTQAVGVEEVIHRRYAVGIAE